jgi:hypothetical protein
MTGAEQQQRVETLGQDVAHADQPTDAVEPRGVKRKLAAIFESGKAIGASIGKRMKFSPKKVGGLVCAGVLAHLFMWKI